MADKVRYGGQAVIEGVMMRGPRYFAVACRKLDGEIFVQRELVPAFFTRYKWARWPFMRGVFALADSLVLGMKALLFSANLAMEQENAKAKRDLPPPDPLTQALIAPLELMMGSMPTGTIGNIAVAGTAFAGMGIGIALFMLFPSLVAGWFAPLVGKTIWLSAIEGVARVIVVLSYIAIIGQRKEVQRLFQYHGAEHKAINGYEMEGVVSVEAAEKASRIHPRCGTNFVLTVLLVKALIFAIVPWQNDLLLRLGSRLLMLPVVGSVAYEVIFLAGKYRNFAPLQWFIAPGLMTQYLTTREPAREMVEVAVASLQGVLVENESPKAVEVSEEVAPVV